MVIAGVFEKRTFRKGEEKGRAEGREEGRVEGREQGREENQRLWEAWLSRRLQAEARGEPFTEPPPGTDGRNAA